MLHLLKRFGFNDEELISIYKNYVRPVVEYADVAWSSSITVAQKKTLEHLQKCACRSILGQRYTSYADAIHICGLESLDDRKESHCLRFAEKLTIQNVQMTSFLLSDGSLTPTTCAMRIITPIYVPGQLGSTTAQYLISSTCWTSRVSMNSFLNKLNDFNPFASEAVYTRNLFFDRLSDSV